ncbi:hypothetical protein [Streptomyces sp. NPDC006638]|uniref:hypothetical protein n=1 Tax=unclassified Streptomyces TaxID=2593676 RepID=UPI0033B9839B
MALLFFGKDPDTDEDHCPTVWVDDENGDFVFQGWRADAVTEKKCLEVGPIPGTEAVIRIPARMVAQIRKACDAAERSAAELR